MFIRFDDIVLRAIEEEDLDLLRNLINDPDIENMSGGASFPVSKFQQRRWFESLIGRKDELRTIIDTNKHGPIGSVMLTNIDLINRSAQFHIKIVNNEDVRGQGFGTKATKAMIQYAFLQLNLHCIYSYIIDYNYASQKIHEKCGFEKEGTLKERVYKNGNYFDVLVYSLINKGILNEL